MTRHFEHVLRSAERLERDVLVKMLYYASTFLITVVYAWILIDHSISTD